MKRSGVADLPLHRGHVPAWFATRMVALGGAIAEAVVHHYGRPALLARLSDPFWFQALGCVMGMDWIPRSNSRRRERALRTCRFR